MGMLLAISFLTLYALWKVGVIIDKIVVEKHFSKIVLHPREVCMKELIVVENSASI